MTLNGISAAVLATAVLQAASPAETPPAVAPRLAEGAVSALDTSPAIAAARASLSAAGHERRAATWLRWPSVSVGALTGGPVGGGGPFGDATLQVEVFQPVWDGGRIQGGIDRARALEAVARASVSEAELTVLLQMAAAYHDAMRTRRVAAIMGESLAEHRLLVASMRRRVEQDVSPRTDLELAVARTAQVEQEMAAVQAQHDAAVRRFRTLVGDDGFEVGEPAPYRSDVHHPFGDEAVGAAVDCHPRLSRLAGEALLARAEERARRAEVWPTLGVQYSHDRFGGHQIGLSLRARTAGGLSPLAAADSASARRQGADHQVFQARREVEEAVALDLVENLSARARIAGSGAAATSTANVMESFLRQFSAGRRTWLDVMNAVRERTAARIALAEVESSAMSSATRLLLNSCAWRPADISGVDGKP